MVVRAGHPDDERVAFSAARARRGSTSYLTGSPIASNALPAGAKEPSCAVISIRHVHGQGYPVGALSVQHGLEVDAQGLAERVVCGARRNLVAHVAHGRERSSQAARLSCL